MWFGTEDGLNRYDGYEFKVYRHSVNNKNSISHNWIWDIFEDKDKNLWIATWNGLTKYDLKKDTFETFFPDTTDEKSISGNRPSSICSDKYGHIWIATWGGGLNMLDPSTGIFTSYRHSGNNNNGIPSDLVRYVLCDSKNRLWTGTWEGLMLAGINDKGIVRLTKFNHSDKNRTTIGSDHIKKIIEDSEGNIWIGTMGGGLNMFVEKDSSFIKYLHDPDNENTLSSNNICEITEDKNGNLWLGTPENGLNFFDRRNNTITRVYSDIDDPQGLISNNVYSIYAGRSGLIWIGAGGLNIFNLNSSFIEHYKHNKRNKHTLTANNVTCFYQSDDNRLWIGTKGGGLNCFDIKTKKFIALKYNAQTAKLIKQLKISGISSIDNETLWVTTSGQGIFLYNTKTNSYKKIHSLHGIRNIGILNFVNSVCTTDKRHLWFATYDKGLISYDTKKDIAMRISEQNTKIDQPVDYLLTLYPDTDNKLWIGSWGAGVYCLDLKSRAIRQYLPGMNNSSSSPGNMIYSFNESMTGTGVRTLWAGTDNGLTYIRPGNRNENKIYNMIPDTRLNNLYIYGILPGKRETLWLSTNRGLILYNTATGRTRPFDIHDGIQSIEYNPGAALKLRDNALAFGGIKGFNIIYPDKYKQDSFHPPVVLTTFKIFNKEMKFDKALQETDNIKLTYKQSFFSFEYTALDFMHSTDTRYFYRMKGIEDKWIDAGKRRYASYTNIPPGDYTFQVKAVSYAGVPSDNTLSIGVTITPPFRQTIWFKGIMLLIILLIFYSLHKIRLQKLLAIEKLRLRIASDLHDDIGSALTRIAITSEQIQGSNDKERNKKLTKAIGETSREVISSMSDIVWSIDSRNDSISDIIDRMKDLTYSTLMQKEIKVDFRISGLNKEKKVPVNIRQNLFYIFKESINNIVKHSNATEVTILFMNTDSNFILEISDNGSGFNPEEVKTGNGLRNMKLRASAIKAELKTETSNGVKITLIMKRL
jgi:ligand-binding sensor domain-containing protein/two-component sensor histidine kinase